MFVTPSHIARMPRNYSHEIYKEESLALTTTGVPKSCKISPGPFHQNSTSVPKQHS